MLCKYCGAVVDGEASFCDECGKPLHGGALAAKAASGVPSVLDLTGLVKQSCHCFLSSVFEEELIHELPDWRLVDIGHEFAVFPAVTERGGSA